MTRLLSNWKIGRAATGMSLALMLMAFAAPAHADPYDHDHGHPPPHHEAAPPDRDWQRHEDEARRWHERHPRPEPRVVYAPPVIVAAPPEPTGINLIIPLIFH